MNNNVIIMDCERINEKTDLSKFEGKDILITGATGLIGTYLLYSVYVFNRTSSDPIKVTIVSNRPLPDHLADISVESWLSVLHGDLSDVDFLHSLGMYDAIIHAAGYGQPGKFLENKLKTLTLNTSCTQYLLSRVRHGGHFLFVSTSEVYSGSEDIPYTEKTHGVTMPDHPRACYIEGKRCGEAFCNVYAGKGDFKVNIARVALAYGPGVRPDDQRVLYSFIRKALGGSIEMLDAGTAQRVYCYVSDTVENLWNIMLKGKEVTYNVGGISHTSIFELADSIAKILHTTVKISQDNDSKMNGAPQNVDMDISKVNGELGKTDYVPLENGLQRTIEWYRQYFA